MKLIWLEAVIIFFLYTNQNIYANLIKIQIFPDFISDLEIN